MVSSSALCSRRPRFTSFAGDHAFWLGFFVIFLNFDRQTPGWYRPITSQPLSSTSHRIPNILAILPLDTIQGVPGGKVNILGGHMICHSKQKYCICTCVLFRTVSEIELFHCTVHCTLYRRATRHVLTRVVKCIDVDLGIYWTVLC
jgi:hypothetical protein